MRYLAITFFLLLSACATIKIPNDFRYEEISANGFIIATWQKITSVSNPVKIYIEGDGRAFNSYGMPTKDPTPKGEMMRELTYGDNSPNVVYMARVCQYKKSALCDKKYWTTARFAPEVIKAHYLAIKQIAQGREVILIGFSGGAQIAGLLAATTDLRVRKVITLAGNLDHKTWCEYHNLPYLNESLNLADYQNAFSKIPQIHYVGEKDKVIPPQLSRDFVVDKNLIKTVNNADHNSGWDKVYNLIRYEN